MFHKLLLVLLVAAICNAGPLDTDDKSNYPDDNNRYHWIDEGEKFAQSGIADWDDIAAHVNQGRDSMSKEAHALEAQLLTLQKVTDDIIDNNRKTASELLQVVVGLNGLASGEQGPEVTAKFRSLLALITGKRDHKSYYLSGGAISWLEQRIATLTTSYSSDLRKQLHAVMTVVTEARTALDSGAQVFVGVVAKLNQLAGDYEANREQIVTVTSRLISAFKQSPLLQFGETVKVNVNSLVVEFRGDHLWRPDINW